MPKVTKVGINHRRLDYYTQLWQWDIGSLGLMKSMVVSEEFTPLL